MYVHCGDHVYLHFGNCVCVHCRLSVHVCCGNCMCMYHGIVCVLCGDLVCVRALWGLYVCTVGLYACTEGLHVCTVGLYVHCGIVCVH